MGPTTLGAILTHWSFEPSVIAGLAAIVAAFTALQFKPDMAVGAGRRVCFAIGLALLALALLSPLDELSDRYLLVAHMVQHLVLVLVAAPLLTRCIPEPWARRLTVAPVVAFALFNAVFGLSHLPVWYEATLIHEPLHVLEHLAYIITAIINWLPVMSPARERRLAEPLQMLYLFLETLPMFLVGSLLALADSAVYPLYLRAPRIVGISAVEDQSLAGLLMWIGGSFFYLGALSAVFFRWANREIGLSQPPQEETWLNSTRQPA